MKTIEQIERQRKPIYKHFITEWNKILFAQIAPYIEAAKDTATMEQFKSIPLQVKAIEKTFLKTWVVTGKIFAKDTYSENKKTISCPIHTKATEDDFFDKYMYEFALNSAGERITSITQTNKEAILKVIRNAIFEGEQDGMGAIEMGKLIQEKLKSEMTIISRYSAERIARTEVVGACNRGQLIGAQSLGYNMQKSWMPYLDPYTRTFEKGAYNHAFQEVVGLYDKFQGTGQLGGIDHPGDPKGDAGNVINCRCTCGYKVL